MTKLKMNKAPERGVSFVVEVDMLALAEDPKRSEPAVHRAGTVTIQGFDQTYDASKGTELHTKIVEAFGSPEEEDSEVQFSVLQPGAAVVRWARGHVMCLLRGRSARFIIPVTRGLRTYFARWPLS